MNECEAETLTWKCACSDGKFPRVQPAAAMPIETQQCDGEVLACVDDCLVTVKPDRNFCTSGCKNLKKCGTSSVSQEKTFREKSVADTQDESSGAFPIVAGGLSLAAGLIALV